MERKTFHSIQRDLKLLICEGWKLVGINLVSKGKELMTIEEATKKLKKKLDSEKKELDSGDESAKRVE